MFSWDAITRLSLHHTSVNAAALLLVWLHRRQVLAMKVFLNWGCSSKQWLRKVMKQPYKAILGSVLMLGLLLFVVVLAQTAKRGTSNSTTQPSLAEASAVPMDSLPILHFHETVFDFGTVTHDYEFTNTGQSSLIIYEVIASCNLCTTAAWSRRPIQVGEHGKIQVTFNSAGRLGKQGKYLIIRANTDPPETRLLLKGEVEPAS